MTLGRGAACIRDRCSECRCLDRSDHPRPCPERPASRRSTGPTVADAAFRHRRTPCTIAVQRLTRDPGPGRPAASLDAPGRRQKRRTHPAGFAYPSRHGTWLTSKVGKAPGFPVRPRPQVFRAGSGICRQGRSAIVPAATSRRPGWARVRRTATAERSPQHGKPHRSPLGRIQGRAPNSPGHRHPSGWCRRRPSATWRRRPSAPFSSLILHLAPACGNRASRSPWAIEATLPNSL